VIILAITTNLVKEVTQLIEQYVPDMLSGLNSIKLETNIQMNVSPEILSLLTVKYNSTETDLVSATGAPIEIPVNNSSEVTEFTAISGRTPSEIAAVFREPAYVQAQMKLLGQQIVYNENKLILNYLNTVTGANTITVDTSADLTAPTSLEFMEALSEAHIDLKNMGYVDNKYYMLIDNNFKSLLTSNINNTEYKSLSEYLYQNNIKYMPVDSTLLPNKAVLLPIDAEPALTVYIGEDIQPKFTVDQYEMGSIFARETIAVHSKDPSLIQVLDLTTQ